MKPRSLRLLTVVTIVGLILAACGGNGGSTTTTTTDVISGMPETIRFGVTPADDSAGQEERFGAMVKALEADLGTDVEFITTGGTYGGLIEALIANRLEIAVMSPFAYVIATGKGAEIEARAAYITEPGGPTTYQSHGLARSDRTDVQSLEDYEGKKVCFVDPSSASGYLIPAAGLLEIGIDPDEDLEEAIFAGAHDNSVLAIADGTCDAGFAVDSELAQLEETGDVEPGALHVVWESDPIPGVVLAIQKSLPQEVRDAITRVFLDNDGADLYERGFCSPEWVEEDGPTGEPWCPIAGTSTWGFAEVDDSLYDSLREVCRLTEAPACTE
jgi:phosphonate transport system substrate-binding protein